MRISDWSSDVCSSVLLFWVAALMAANLIVRPIVILSLVGGFDNYDGFQQSIYWTTVQFSQAMVSVLAAISLMVAIAVDLIAELRQQAESDPLSGLLNRRGFEAIGPECEASKDRKSTRLNSSH